MTAPTRTETPGRRAITCKCGQLVAWRYGNGTLATIGARVVSDRGDTRQRVICPRCGCAVRVERDVA